MMNHDPFQTYQTTGAYSTGVSPYGLPYTGQPFIHPAALAGQQLANPAVGGYGFNPQQQMQGFGQNPLLQNPLLQQQILQNQILQNQLLQQQLLQNPLLQGQILQQNPLAQAGWQNPQHGWPQQQQFGGYPLASQSPFGGGIGQPYGQIHPLAQLALRQAQAGYGISPFAGTF